MGIGTFSNWYINRLLTQLKGLMRIATFKYDYKG
jgi:hypothetical protein